MKIIADDGGSRYLIIRDDELRGDTMGRVLDAAEGVLYAPISAHSILARGGWFEYDGSQDMLDPLMDSVNRIEEADESPPPDFPEELLSD